MLDVVACMHDVLHCLALIVFAITGNPNQPIVSPTRRSGILMSNVIYGSSSLDGIPCQDLTVSRSAEGSDRQNIVDHWLGLKHRSSVWECSSFGSFCRSVVCLILFCSGGLAYILLVTVADLLYAASHNFL